LEAGPGGNHLDAKEGGVAPMCTVAEDRQTSIWPAIETDLLIGIA
jgi:hypothetical protein